MPSVGTRRSTRVFVPKSKSSLITDTLSPVPTAHIRSVKANSISRQEADVADSDWFGLLSDWTRDRSRGAVADGLDRATMGEAPSGAPMEEKIEKSPDIVYTRKRPRQKAVSSGSNGQSKRYGTVYIRKGKNKIPKLESVDPRDGLGVRTSAENARRSVQEHLKIVPRSSWDLARRLGVSENDITTHFKGNSVVLSVFVELKCKRSSRIFLGFLLSVLGWIGSNSRAKIWRLISFLLKGPIARVFSAHGVHFLPILEGKDDVLPGDSYPFIGFCKMHEFSKSTPLLYLNFSALPSYFTTLHLAISLPSLYIPTCLTCPLSSSSESAPISTVTMESHAKPCSPKETGSHVTTTYKISSKVSETSAGRNNPLSYSTEALSPLPEFSTILHSSRLKGHQQKKRSSNRISRSSKSHAEKSPPVRQSAPLNLHISSYRLKPLELPPDDSSQSGIDSDVSTPLGKHKRSSSLKSPVDRVHERLALAEAKQNIDSVQCKANILVTLEDRCYREDDAILSMEESESNEWLICVTLQDTSKFRHKPNEMRPCVVNRFTHAYMWTVDEVMRLEFVEKLDWLLFKELHAECRTRNAREKVKEVVPLQIPTPGVVVVPGYNAGMGSDRFMLPDTYIRVLDDEVERAMRKEGAIYDADSSDERWLDGFNDRGSGRVSLDEFEMLISMFEKDAYINLEGVGDIEGVLDRCKELNRDDATVAVYNYWFNKRKMREASKINEVTGIKEVALIKFFQGAKHGVLTRRGAQWAQKYLKKKRSFKRQRSQVVVRPKSEQALQHDCTEEEAVQKVHNAEADAYQVIENAIQLRTHAQVLMEQAELATYRAIMALRISDALSRMPDTVLDPQPDPDAFHIL